MSKRLLRWWLLTTICFSLLACDESVPVFFDSGQPQRLSEWNLFSIEAGRLLPNSDSLVFRPINQLFTDYASKLRTVWIAGDEKIMLSNSQLTYPVGTVLSKTFYYSSDETGTLSTQPEPGHEFPVLQAGQLVETRLLVRRSNGWEAFPYIWNQDQTEAFLRVAGGSARISLAQQGEQLDFTYFVPNENQCAGCHVTEHPQGEMQPLGATFNQLAVDNSASGVLAAMQGKGWIDAQVARSNLISWQDTNQDLDVRAMAYLDIHCGHCHNPEGAADTSALILDGSAAAAIEMGVCKPPVAAGGGSGNLQYGIVPGHPDESILLYRMESTDPAVMMPELGRSLVHKEGAELIREWIAKMAGSCE